MLVAPMNRRANIPAQQIYSRVTTVKHCCNFSPVYSYKSNRQHQKKEEKHLLTYVIQPDLAFILQMFWNFRVETSELQLLPLCVKCIALFYLFYLLLLRWQPFFKCRLLLSIFINNHYLLNVIVYYRSNNV